MADFLTDDQIAEYFRILNPSFSISDIPTLIRSASYEEITQKSGFTWEAIEQTLYFDGDGTKHLFVTPIPIVSLVSMTLIGEDLAETSVNVTQTSATREIWYEPNTGKIEIINPIDNIEYGNDEEAGVFPKGIRNIKIVGTFGTSSPASILSLLQLCIINRTMARLNPSVYAKGDILEEEIGKYRYVLAGRTTSDSTRMSLDQYIEYLFSLLPQFNSFVYEAV